MKIAPEWSGSVQVIKIINGTFLKTLTRECKALEKEKEEKLLHSASIKKRAIKITIMTKTTYRLESVARVNDQ